MMVSHLYSTKKHSWRIPAQFEVLESVVARMDVVAQQPRGVNHVAMVDEVSEADIILRMLEDADDDEPSVVAVLSPPGVIELDDDEAVT